VTSRRSGPTWLATTGRRRASSCSRIELHLGPALDTLAGLLAAGRAGTYDFVFLDADKANLGRYYELALELLRPGGVVAIDNTLWSGRVADPEVTDADTEAIRRLGERIHADERVDMVLVPVGDGLTVARRR